MHSPPSVRPYSVHPESRLKQYTYADTMPTIAVCMDTKKRKKRTKPTDPSENSELQPPEKYVGLSSDGDVESDTGEQEMPEVFSAPSIIVTPATPKASAYLTDDSTQATPKSPADRHKETMQIRKKLFRTSQHGRSRLAASTASNQSASTTRPGRMSGRGNLTGTRKSRKQHMESEVSDYEVDNIELTIEMDVAARALSDIAVSDQLPIEMRKEVARVQAMYNKVFRLALRKIDFMMG